MEEEVSRIFSNPINTSLASGCIVFIFSLAILPKIRPKFILKLNEKRQHVIDTYKMTIFSVLLGCSMAICVFLVVYKTPVIEAVEVVKPPSQPVIRSGISY